MNLHDVFGKALTEGIGREKNTFSEASCKINKNLALMSNLINYRMILFTPVYNSISYTIIFY